MFSVTVLALNFKYLLIESFRMVCEGWHKYRAHTCPRTCWSWWTSNYSLVHFLSLENVFHVWYFSFPLCHLMTDSLCSDSLFVRGEDPTFAHTIIMFMSYLWSFSPHVAFYAVVDKWWMVTREWFTPTRIFLCNEASNGSHFKLFEKECTTRVTDFSRLCCRQRTSVVVQLLVMNGWTTF